MSHPVRSIFRNSEHTLNSTLAGFFCVALIAGSLNAQVDGRVTDTISLNHLAVSDDGNDPINEAPGHTAEALCGSKVLELSAGQIDITDTYLRVEHGGRLHSGAMGSSGSSSAASAKSGSAKSSARSSSGRSSGSASSQGEAQQGSLLHLVTFYNAATADPAAEQFWFIDADNDLLTGGGDNVQLAGLSPCADELPATQGSGYEFYVHSFGSSSIDVAAYVWLGSMWQEVLLSELVINSQGASDNPNNSYGGQNGFRAVTGIDLDELGIGSDGLSVCVRSYSPENCCGDSRCVERRSADPGVLCFTTLCGDADLNDRVNILDALKVAQHAVRLLTITGVAFSNANVIGDYEPGEGAELGILDALMIARNVVGLGDLSCCMP